MVILVTMATTVIWLLWLPLFLWLHFLPFPITSFPMFLCRYDYVKAREVFRSVDTFQLAV